MWRSNSFVNNKTAAALSVVTTRFAGLSSSISPVRGYFYSVLHFIMLLCNHSFSHINFLTCDRIRNVSFFSFQSSIAADRRAARVVTSLNCCTCEQFDLRVSPLAVCFCRPCVPTVHCGLVGFVYLFSIFSFRALRCTCTFLFCGLQQLLGLGLGLSDCD